MGGAINYYHGEPGLVIDRQYIVTEELRVHALRLRDDPYREFAYDYEGGDVGIDLLLMTEDRAVFVRVDSYTGIWVRERDQFYPELPQAIDRVTKKRRENLKPGQVTIRLHGIWAEQYIADETQSKTGNPLPERPDTDVSFFLSFSNKNVLLARQIFEDLKYDAKVEVWFDIDQAGESPEHVRRVQTCLREAVYESRGFILVWTQAAKESGWVRKGRYPGPLRKRRLTRASISLS